MPKERYMDPWERGARTELLSAALRIVVVAGGEFPQDDAGLSRLVEQARYEDEERGGPVEFEYEPPAEFPRYSGDFKTWVGHARSGALRLRVEHPWLRAVAADLRSDGTVGELTLEEGFEAVGESEDRLSEQARGDLEAVKRKRERADASDREWLKAEPEFRGDSLLRVAIAPWQDPSSLVITWVALFAGGVTVNYLLPGPDDSGGGKPGPVSDIDAEPAIELSDDLGTSYSFVDFDLLTGDNEATLRARQDFTPAVPDDATFLIARSDAGPVEIKLRD